MVDSVIFLIYYHPCMLFMQHQQSTRFIIFKSMSNSYEQELQKHNEKWKKWMTQLSHDNLYSSQKVKPVQTNHLKDDSYQYAVKLINKLNDGGSSQINYHNVQKKVEVEFQNNVCYICTKIMLPPKKPIILFPCSHNICQQCIYEDGTKAIKKHRLKMKKCPICKVEINNHAPNWNLMALLCAFTNNKELLQKEMAIKEQQQLEMQQQEKQLSKAQIEKLRIRCDILNKEKNSLDLRITKDTKSLSILEKALEKLEEQRSRNHDESKKLKQQEQLIKDFIAQKQRELAKVQASMESAEEKQKVVTKTLEPLRRQTEKMEILEAARNI